MDDENTIYGKENSSEKIGIFVKRMLAKYLAVESQMLFQEKRDTATGEPLAVKEPLRIYINNAGGNGENSLQEITEVIMSLTEAPSDVIISNSKSRIKVTFKVFLLVKYQDLTIPSLIVLPDDIGDKCMTQYDLTMPQHVNNGSARELLQISDGNFMYLVDVPLSEFDNQITSRHLNDPTLQSYVSLNNFSWSVDVDNVSRNGSGDPPALATAITLSISEDILNKIGIDQDIIVNGISEDY